MSEGQSSSSHSQDMRNEQQGQDKRNEQQAETVFGDFAHFVYSDEGNETASVAVHRAGVGWVLDSGASKHVTGNVREFECYQ